VGFGADIRRCGGIVSRRILIVGHGAAGRGLAEDVREHGDTVVGFLDDMATSPDVIGTLADVNKAIRDNSVDMVYIAIPSASARMLREFIGTIEADHIELAIIPRTYEIITKETVNIDDLTDIDVLDLVGRQPVKHDLLAAREFIAGKTIMITGAAGSIGSRLARQLAGMEPAKVVCVDWWENGMFFLGQELGDQQNIVLRIADIKNVPAMEVLFEEHQPDIVFHAAAYKHVPLMQDNPAEALTNNVLGTLRVMQLAIRHRVKNFVYVSTDKAVNPVNVMGATKRIGEMLMLSLAGSQTGTRFNAVRFGNVIQSNGSVMQIFRNQIAKKLPLTVTHPDVTRFFMTIDEASQLIIQTALIGEDSEIFVLDMGEPVRILDLARSLVRAVDPSLTIDIIGMRPGEKMYEELSYEPDLVGSTSNPKIFVVRDSVEAGESGFVDSIESLLAEVATYQLTNNALIERLRGLGFAIQ
jgi:FlaA1/EpsC-like NDP-sugar epimerase